MKSLVYIDACMRKDSRTRRIAKPIISQLSERYTITKFVLNELPLEIVKEDRIQQRMHGNYDPQSLSWAKKIRDADQIVIAAPFWDMSYPAALKNFLEFCSVFNVIFKSDDKTCSVIVRQRNYYISLHAVWIFLPMIHSNWPHLI